MSSHSVQLPVSFHFDLHLPALPAPALLVCTHGYSQDKTASLKFGRGVGDDLALAALQAPHPHFKNRKFELGFSWVSPFNSAEGVANHHAFVRHVIDEAHAAGHIPERKAFLFGFSQSVSLNYRFARVHPDYLHGVIAVAGAAPSDWKVGGEPDIEVPALHIAATEDEAYSLERSRGFKAVLESHFKHLSYLEEPGPHRVPQAAYPKIRAWMSEQLTE